MAFGAGGFLLAVDQRLERMLAFLADVFKNRHKFFLRHSIRIENEETSQILDGAPTLEKPTTPFRANRWLRAGHVQTIARFLLPRRIHLPPPEYRMTDVAPHLHVRFLHLWPQHLLTA